MNGPLSDISLDDHSFHLFVRYCFGQVFSVNRLQSCANDKPIVIQTHAPADGPSCRINELCRICIQSTGKQILIFQIPSKFIQLRIRLHVPFFFMSSAPLIFLTCFTSCVNNTIGMHSNHFKTARKTVQKTYV